MIFLKKIICVVGLLLCASYSLAQNKKNHPPSPQNLPPYDYFSWLHSCAGDTTCFINQSVRSFTYTWTVIGDSTNFLGAHFPKKIFTAKDDSMVCVCLPPYGTYTVAFNAYDNHYDSITKIITIDTITKANFSYINCTNNLSNHSLCAHSFYWNFGDGGSSNNPIPNHQYADTGTYQITLIAYNGAKSDTMKQSTKIACTGNASAAYTYTVSHDTVWMHALDSHIPKADFFWSFGDGHYASGRDTFHVYKDSTATYGINLNAVNPCGPTFGIADSVYIIQQAPPQANFSFLKTCWGDTTCFINQSTAGNTYTWTVVSSSSSLTPLYSTTNTQFCYAFPATGTYSVTLTANNHFSENSITKIVSIGTIPVANFSFTPCSNLFSNSSSCATSFYWNFGDGSHSSQNFPQHQYADTGHYTVSLTAHNGIDSNTITKIIYVAITSAPTATFTSLISFDTLRVQSTYTSTPAAAYTWSFGDGTHATGVDTLHVYYDTTQTYIVKLSISNICGTALGVDTINIMYYNNRPPAGLDFSNSILSIVPNPVTNNSYIDAFFNTYDDNTYLVQIFNDIGQKTFEENFAFQTGINEFKISTASMPAGVYIMVMQAGNSYIRQKFYIIPN
ncbi:MAG: PKD domain-containing protein [Bacteroidetes bacterium]|nr:PKD domain-containing protein [Bacteroidota bacterium]